MLLKTEIVTNVQQKLQQGWLVFWEAEEETGLVTLLAYSGCAPKILFKTDHPDEAEHLADSVENLDLTLALKALLEQVFKPHITVK